MNEQILQPCICDGLAGFGPLSCHASTSERWKADGAEGPWSTFSIYSTNIVCSFLGVPQLHHRVPYLVSLTLV